MKSKTKSTNKPVFEQQITGAANDVTSAYNANKGSLQAGADQFAGILPSILDKYQNDPTNALARTHYNDVLSGKYLDAGNPYLQQQIDNTGNDVRNGISASLGTRGLTGGSDYAGIIARELAKNSAGLRYQDYNTQSNRMANAAASVGNLAAADGNYLDQALAAYRAQTAPLLAAQDYGGTIGGLLGSYQNTKSTQKGSIGGLLGGLAGSALSAWAGGGFKGV